MDIRDLRYAVATLETGSFARAAERLYVSRQALSQSVKRLEAEANLRLFSVQGNNRLVPTPEGAAFLDDARRIVDDFDGLLERYGIGVPTGMRPQALTIAMATGTVLSLPEGLLAGFRADNPNVSQQIEETSTNGALGLLDEDCADVAFVGSCPRYLERYEYRLVVATGLWLSVPHENPLSSREALVLSDLEGQTVVTAGRLNHLHRYLVEVCEEAGVHVVIPTTSSNTEMLVKRACELRALFFSFPPSILPPQTTRDAAIVALQTPESSLFGTYLVRSKGKRHSAAANALWNYAGMCGVGA